MENYNKPSTSNIAPQAKKANFVTEFLWNFAGVNKTLLRQCPNEWAKYAGMGGTILSTAIMAACSGGYAIYLVFQSMIISVIFGTFWGVLIMNLDRFITSTMYSDGKHTISWEEIKAGFPRIIMAIFLGIIISTPIEMRLFEERINVEIQKINTQRLSEYDDMIRDQYSTEKLETEQKAINDEIARLQLNVETMRQILQEEIDGRSGSGKKGDGPAAKQKRLNLRDAERDLRDYKEASKEKMAKIDLQIEEILAQKAMAEKTYKEPLQENGFCQSYEAFAKIEDESIELKWAVWFIRLLFIIIEVAPTLLRMMMASGAYDELLRAQSLSIAQVAKKDCLDIMTEYETEVAISTERNRVRLEAETRANQELYQGIASAQSEILQRAIDQWKVSELEKVSQDPTTYLKVN